MSQLLQVPGSMAEYDAPGRSGRVAGLRLGLPARIVHRLSPVLFDDAEAAEGRQASHEILR